MKRQALFSVLLISILLLAISPSVLAGEVIVPGSQIVGADLSGGFVAVAADEDRSLGLKEDGSIVAWGSNRHGQCNIPSPNTCFVAASAGSDHSLGLKEDGSIVAWGGNWRGQRKVPLPNSGFTAVAAGGWHSLGLKGDGSIVAWGSNRHGQCCNIPSPNSGFVAIAAGGYHNLGLKEDGSIVGWGANWYGQCNIPSPNSGFTAVAAGYYYSLGLKEDGSIVGWGQGQRRVPLPNSGFVAVAAGMYHSLGLKEDGSIVAWGWNHFGQCNVPLPNTGFVAVAAGIYHSLGLKEDGSIVAWGWNSDGQCNVPSPNNGFTAIAAGYYHSLAIVRDNTAPIACIVGGDRVVEADANCEVRVVLDGTCSSDEDSTEGTNDDIVSFDWYEIIDPCDANSDIYFGSGEVIECNLPLGEHDIMLEVTDKADAFDINEVTITVEDVTPPEFSLSVEPNVLWPVNHKMVEIRPSWEVSDNCDEWPDVSLVSITMNEDAETKGGGHTIGDIWVDANDGIWLRAERRGKGTGRVYTITYQAVDDSNNVTVDSAIVTVPHDMK